jgi:transposase InsO family protein
VPAASTITGILAREGLLRPGRRLQRDWQRFEAEAPNELLQMDFKGHVPAGRQRCHPLTIIDDHSRFSLCIAACTDERRETVQTQLTKVFERYGLPERILTDNGSPWGSAGQGDHTRLTAWLIRLGIGVSHGRPHHPQTQGKNERFHRTLVAEVLSRKAVWRDIDELQRAFDAWRDVYNFERPHDALGLDVPASRYRPSPRPFPSPLPPVEYECGAEVRKVRDNGQIKFGGRLWFVGKAFYGEPVAIRPVAADVWDVYYCRQVIAHLDPTTRDEV